MFAWPKKYGRRVPRKLKKAFRHMNPMKVRVYTKRDLKNYKWRHRIKDNFKPHCWYVSHGLEPDWNTHPNLYPPRYED